MANPKKVRKGSAAQRRADAKKKTAEQVTTPSTQTFNVVPDLFSMVNHVTSTLYDQVSSAFYASYLAMTKQVQEQTPTEQVQEQTPTEQVQEQAPTEQVQEQAPTEQEQAAATRISSATRGFIVRKAAEQEQAAAERAATQINTTIQHYLARRAAERTAAFTAAADELAGAFDAFDFDTTAPSSNSSFCFDCLATLTLMGGIATVIAASIMSLGTPIIIAGVVAAVVSAIGLFANHQNTSAAIDMTTPAPSNA